MQERVVVVVGVVVEQQAAPRIAIRWVGLLKEPD
jgi:hypothetical protein